MKTIRFFLTNREVCEALDFAESRKPWYLCKSGLFASGEEARMISLLDELSNFAGSSNLGVSFLIKNDPSFTFEIVSQRKGGYRFAFDPQRDPNASLFQPSGFIEARCLVPGAIVTPLANVQDSFADYFIEALQNIGGVARGIYWVSTGCQKGAANGCRLVANGNPNSPLDYDLAL